MNIKPTWEGKPWYSQGFIFIIGGMKKVIGYMVTWTTYGSWLQGDKRGYVKDGVILGADAKLQKANRERQKSEIVKLNKKQRDAIKAAILEEAKKLYQAVYALTVCSNHVHIVAEGTDETVSNVVGHYKRAGTIAMRQMGFGKKVWTKGFDKRYCFEREH